MCYSAILANNSLANWVLMVCPGYLANIFPTRGRPIKVMSPNTSNNLCRATSLSKKSLQVFRTPFSLTAMFSLPKKRQIACFSSSQMTFPHKQSHFPHHRLLSSPIVSMGKFRAESKKFCMGQFLFESR